jgi:predicted lysophospholipase L1 biosynthesis ABC-type transport system permease subunit
VTALVRRTAMTLLQTLALLIIALLYVIVLTRGQVIHGWSG